LMTCTVLHWIPVFTRPETVALLLDSLRYLSNDGLILHAYVILENHMHLIAQSADLRRDIARFNSYTSKQVLAYLAENHVSRVLDQLAFYKKAHKRDRSYQFWPWLSRRVVGMFHPTCGTRTRAVGPTHGHY